MGLRTILRILCPGYRLGPGRLTPKPRTSGITPAAALTPPPTPVSLDRPPTIEVPGQRFRIMQGEVTVGLFNQLVAGGYRIVCDNADVLLAKLKGNPGDFLTGLSLLDGYALAKELNRQAALSGRTDEEWAVPTEPEWLTATALVSKQLSGKNKEWTDTTFAHAKGRHPLRSLDFNYRDEAQPGNRLADSALRLIVRKKLP